MFLEGWDWTRASEKLWNPVFCSIKTYCSNVRKLVWILIWTIQVAIRVCSKKSMRKCFWVHWILLTSNRVGVNKSRLWFVACLWLEQIYVTLPWWGWNWFCKSVWGFLVAMWWYSFSKWYVHNYITQL